MSTIVQATVDVSVVLIGRSGREAAYCQINMSYDKEETTAEELYNECSKVALNQLGLSDKEYTCRITKLFKWNV